MSTVLPRKYADESLLVVPNASVNAILPDVGVWPISEALLDLISTPSMMRRGEAEQTTRVEFSPFPIDEPSLLKHYVGKSMICATTRLYAWNEEKIRRLENEGYAVVVLEKCIKQPFDGSTIRRHLMDRDPDWKDMVLPSVAELLVQWAIDDRIRDFAQVETLSGSDNYTNGGFSQK
jgi:hypothetical protein